MCSAIIIPPKIEAVIQDFDGRTSPYSEMDVYQALSQAREPTQNVCPEENQGSWAELLAFGLTETRGQPSPWGTFFGPLGSGTDGEGKTIYFPDIAQADAEIFAHWLGRAKSTKHPVLTARYADLAWDLGPRISGVRREPEMARRAIDAYLGSISPIMLAESYERFGAAIRALDLAEMIRDSHRIDLARIALLKLHRDAIANHEPQWSRAYDRLMYDKNAGVSDAERNQFIADLEALVVLYSDATNPQTFNPHALQDAAKRLIKYYARLHQPHNTKRLHATVAKGFEHFASLGDAMLASAVLQTSIDSYREAGLPEESKRVRVLMQEKIGQSRDQMTSFETRIEIPHDDVEKFLSSIVTDDLGATFARIAGEFLSKRNQLEEAVQKIKEQAPLSAHISQSIVADDHVVGRVGSVDEDPYGRLIQHTNMNFGFLTFWLEQALRRTIEVHKVVPEHFAAWANRFEIFDNLTFLIDGLRAWCEGDLVKAIHVLVPQIEQGLRGIVAKLGKPVTKPHPTVTDISVVLTVGDILYAKEITEILGPDLTLHLVALYADPRGMNLRNRVAHGIIKPESINENIALWLIHTLLLFGVLRELTRKF